MTSEFKQAFERLCERWPEKYKVSHLSPYWILDPNDVCIYSASDDTRYLWFLHKLAESLGGVVWVEPDMDAPKITRIPMEWVGIYQTSEDGNYCGVHSSQTLALESAVVGLIEAKLNEKEK